MGFFRNREIRRALVISGALSAVFIVIGFLIGPPTGIAVTASCAGLDTVFFIITLNRYRKIADMSHEIDRVLHGQSNLSLERFSEGELAALQTEIGKLTTRLSRQARRLEQDKVFLSDSLADISHQLKTPLTSMRLTVTMLAEPNLTDARREELTRELAMSIGRIQWLVSALLMLSRLDAGTVQLRRDSVGVPELIKESSEPLRISMELRDQSFTVRVPEGTTLTGDLYWTAEAFGNILKNAMEHTPPGGEITVEAQENALFTEIKVWDTGAGFDERDIPHLFERYYRGRNASSQSVGIGLALARTIITHEGGTVKAGNRRDGGAMFTVRFYKSAV